MCETQLEKAYVNRNGDLETLAALKESGKPILIYGNAHCAEVTCRYLSRHGLHVEAFIVDSQYFMEDCYIGNLKVKNLEDYSADIGNYNVVIGFCNVDRVKSLICNSSLLKCKFYFIWSPETICKWDKNYIEKNYDELNRIYIKLADSLSRKTLSLLIDAKLNNDGSRLLDLADNHQYFNELTFCPESQDEIYVDCGAYDGGTILKYVEFVNGKYKKIYAFEPERQNVSTLKKNMENLSNIEIIEKGTWSSNATLKFEKDGSGSRIADAGDVTVQVTTIDEVVGNDRVTFIKMDIEGAELEALKGATKTIQKNRPKLAICCYHKQNDIIDICNFIDSFNDDKTLYKLYLRHHSFNEAETVLYALPVTKVI